MSYHIQYLKDGGVVTNYSGIVTDDNLIQSTKERLSSDTRIKSYRYFISDFSKVDEFKVTTRGIESTVHMAAKASRQNNNILLVVVLPTDSEFGMGRMWQAYADYEKTGWKTLMVRNRDEALEWLQKNLDSASA